MTSVALELRTWLAYRRLNMVARRELRHDFLLLGKLFCCTLIDAGVPTIARFRAGPCWVIGCIGSPPGILLFLFLALQRFNIAFPTRTGQASQNIDKARVVFQKADFDGVTTFDESSHRSS